MTSDFLSFDAIDTNNGVWVYLTVCVCVRAYVWGSLVLGGGVFHVLSQLISLRSIPEVFKEKPKVIIATFPCSFFTFCRREWQPV